MNIGDVYFADYGMPTIANYAKRLGVPLIVIKDRLNPKVHVFFEKLQIAKILNKYDRVLFLDLDVMVNKESPDIFAEVPIKKLGICKQITEYGEEYAKALYSICGDEWTLKTWDGGYYNAGVLVLDKSHQRLLEIPPIKQFANCGRAPVLGDQGQLNFLIRKFKINLHELDEKWNYIPRIHTDPILFACQRNYFIHVAGHKKHILMEKIAKIWGF